MKKVCIIGPSLQMGGMERESCNLANGICELGYKVSYVAIFKHPKFLSLNPAVHFAEPEGEEYTKKLRIVKSIFWLRKTIKRNDPAAVLVFNNLYAALVLIAVAGLKYPVYVRDGASPLSKWRKSIKYFFSVTFRLFPPAGVVAQTSMSALYQKKRFSKKVPITAIPNILREPKDYKLQKKNQVLAVGRLNDYIKGFDRLIEAWSKVKANGWELIFAGGDENSGGLKELIQELKLDGRVRFLGKVTEIDKVYAESKIFVIPSRSEGFPNALCEAMAAGLPCIAFDFISGPRDIITPGEDGIIVEEGNIEALASAIQALINNEEHRIKLGTKARDIRERFKSEKIAKEVLNFILPSSSE